jgi:hypothetical protein
LSNISGINNIDAASINYLKITNNNILSTCEVESICDYLAAPGGSIDIYDNAPGCNSPEEVQEACETVSIENITHDETLQIPPNPVSSKLQIRITIKDQRFVICELYEISGARVKTLIKEQKMPRTYDMTVDISDLKPGIYFCTFKTKEGIQATKLIKL